MTHRERLDAARALVDGVLSELTAGTHPRPSAGGTGDEREEFLATRSLATISRKLTRFAQQRWAQSPAGPPAGDTEGHTQ